MLFNKKKAWRGILLTLVCVLTLSVLAACEKGGSDKEKDASKPVATYEGGEITENEFETQKKIMTFMSPEYAQFMDMADFQDYLVKQKIAFKYLSGKATDDAKKEGEKKAGQQIDQMKKQVGDDQFKQLLSDQKLKEDELKQYLVQVMTVMEDMNAKVTEDDIKKQYEANKQDFMVATVHHILIGLTDSNNKERTKEDALKIAKDVKSQLDKGGDFAELAKKYSDDSSSKDNGGVYKDFTVGQWSVQEFKEQVLTLPLNKISAPVESNLGYSIIKVDSRKDTPYDKLTNDQKEMIRSNLGASKIDQFMQNDLTKIIKKIDLPKTADTSKSGTGTTGTGTSGSGTEGTTSGGSTSGTSGTGTGTTGSSSGDAKTTDKGTTTFEEKVTEPGEGSGK
ncbi:peptidylprolyl isomerase [Paenibacillus favisporus]|uniref:peptidylprolyl isomerase n=1 Tax=Paenibacillus favisporus TaxID=221028 RepID=UPI003D2C7F15